MSGLTFIGNEIISFGEYLPAPYINKIVVEQTNFSIENYIFIKNQADKYVLSGEEAVLAETDYYNQVLNLNYYILLLDGFTDEEYESLKKGEVNPIVFYHQNLEELDSGKQASIFLSKLDTSITSETEILNESKESIIIHSIISEFTQDNTEDDSRYASFWDGDNLKRVEYVFCFSSTFDYFNDSGAIDDDNFNPSLFDLYFGDVSYEKIFNNDGTLAISNSVNFFDINENIYDLTPLQAIDSSVHTLGSIDHEYIKTNIEELLNDYSLQYNSENGNTQLKNVINSIYKTLEVDYLSYDIVPKLEKIRRSFPNKTPTNDVGKLYKRFSKRLYGINNTIKQESILNKRITYNSKILDLKPLSYSVPFPSINESSECLYNKWQAIKLFLDEDSEYSVAAGYFFFDYEKALRTQSELSRFIDVNKLEKNGMHIPYNLFSIEKVEIEKDGSPFITANYSTNSEYPICINNQYSNSYNPSPSNDTDFLFALRDTIYSNPDDFTKTDASNGFITSIINRKYTPIYDTESDIENYRLIMFEYLDYSQNDETSNLNITISVKDNTTQIWSSLKNKIEEALIQLTDYKTSAEQNCIFNNSTGKFNEFFINGILNYYAEDPKSAPWYKPVINYVIQSDLFYNTFGGDSVRIQDEAKRIINKINPINGNLESIESLVIEIENFITNAYTYDEEPEEDISTDFTITLDVSSQNLISEEEDSGTLGGVTTETSGRDFINTEGFDSEMPTTNSDFETAMGDEPSYEDIGTF